MAAKTKVTRLESEIEKFRTESNWSKAADLARQISTKSSPALELLVMLVLSESRIERHLQDNPPTEANIQKTRDELQEALQQLEDILKSEPKQSLKQETLLVLAKLQYAMGDYNGALARYTELKLDTITVENISNRRLKLIGEAFAIKGLCLEKVPLHSPTGQFYTTKQGLCLEKIPLSSSSRYKQAERDEQVLSCFERSGDVSLLQLQELADLGRGTPNSASLASGPWNLVDQLDTTGVGACVETAIQRSPILYIRNGELSKGIGRFRELLRAVESRAVQTLRQTLARQLAEVLLRGVCETTYEHINVDQPINPNKPHMYNGDRARMHRPRSYSRSRSVSPRPRYRRERKFSEPLLDRLRERQAKATSQMRGRSGSMGAMTPGVPSITVTPAHKDRLFVPENQNEETLLLLLIAESMATRDAVLNRSPEHTEARLHTFHNTTAVYDLLTIALVKHAQFNLLSETFERAMKFSFDEFHIWYQFALSLICAEKYQRALLVLKECMRLAGKNTSPFLQAARICYDHLHLVEEGIDYAQQALDVAEGNIMKSRCSLTLGVGYSLKAEGAKLQVVRQEYQRKALNLFFCSQGLDKNDHLAKFHVALQLAILRQIPEALKHVRAALQLRNDHVHSLHLLALLLSAQKQHSDALQLIEATIEEYPDDFNLLFTKSRLEEEVYGVEEALHTCKHMLKYWKECFEATLESEHRGTGLLDRVTNDHRSLVQLTLSELSDRDSAGSMRAESMAASRVEQALSEAASSMNSSFVPKQGPHQTWILQAQIWLHLAELYLSLGRLDEAQACINEAGTIFPVSHLVSYMRGRLYEKKGEMYEAKSCYENAAAINPSHVKSLQHLGLVLQSLGNFRLAEKVLRDAVNADPTAAESWEMLGRTLQLLEEYDAATECLMTAVDMEASSPITHFTVIPRALV